MTPDKPRLPRMDEAQFRSAKKLIRSLCANYDNGNCLLLDDGYDSHICPQRISYSVLCKYFRAAVLPADQTLSAQIMNNPDGLKRCADCRQPFTAESKNTLYCPICAQRRKRRSKCAWARKNRSAE